MIRVALVAFVSCWIAPLSAQALPAAAAKGGAGGVPGYALQLPSGHAAGQWAPLAVLFAPSPAERAPALAAALARVGFVVATLWEAADAGALGVLATELRREHRIAQGGMHAVIGGDAERAVAAVLAQRHEFQSVTVFGAAADTPLDALRRLPKRRVAAVSGEDPAALCDHLVALQRARELDGAAGDVSRTLDSFHDAAAVGDEARYFAILPDDAVFLGTDATERWTGAEFRAFALPYFERPSAWTYVPLERHVTLAPGGGFAWFDEALDNQGYGECRGSGVLAQRGERWVVLQYNLTVPVPNDLLGDVARRIRAFGDGRPRR